MRRFHNMSPTKRAEYNKAKKAKRQVGFFCLVFFEPFFFSLSLPTHFSDPANRDKKNLAARNAYATPAGAHTKLSYKLSAHGNVDVVLPNSCAGNHARYGFIRATMDSQRVNW